MPLNVEGPNFRQPGVARELSFAESHEGHTGIRRALTAGSIAFAVYSTLEQELDTNLLLRF